MIKHLYANGDSLTFGQELNPDRKNLPDNFEFTEHKKTHCYSGLIKAYYGIENYINAAIPGASNDRIFRTTILDVTKLLETIDPSEIFVVIGMTMASRREFFNTDLGKYYQYQSQFNGAEHVKSIDMFWRMYTAYYLSAQEQVERQLIQIISIQNFLKQNKVPYLITTALSSVDTELYYAEELKYEYLKKQIDSKRFMENSFVGMAAHYNLPCGKGRHPLEEAHSVWANLLIRHIDENGLLTHDC